MPTKPHKYDTRPQPRPRSKYVQRVLYTARFEGGELDGRQQAMYGRARSLPWPFINKRLHQRNEFGEFVPIDDFYACTTPHKRVETCGEIRIFRNEPNFELNLK